MNSNTPLPISDCKNFSTLVPSRIAEDLLPYFFHVEKSIFWQVVFYLFSFDCRFACPQRTSCNGKLLPCRLDIQRVELHLHTHFHRFGQRCRSSYRLECSVPRCWRRRRRHQLAGVEHTRWRWRTGFNRFLNNFGNGSDHHW